MDQTPEIILNMKIKKLLNDITFHSSVFQNYFNLKPMDKGLFKNDDVKNKMVEDILKKLLNPLNPLHIEYLNRLHKKNKIKNEQFHYFGISLVISFNNYFYLSFDEKNLLKQKYDNLSNLLLEKNKHCYIS